MYFSPYVQCRHCGTLTTHPRWARVEHLHYECLCHPCFGRLDATFTAEAAIAEVLDLIWFCWPTTIGGVR